MRYVVTVAETNSFTRAAERCLVVQSALSHQIARLERELGAKLFERTSRKVRLTPAGAAFLPAARQCLDAAERAVTEVAAAIGEVRGRLAVGLIPTVAAVDLPGALRDFHKQYPAVRINLSVGASDDLVEQVKQGIIEVAFLGLPTTARPQGVNARELARDRLVAVVAPDHPLAEEQAVGLPRRTPVGLNHGGGGDAVHVEEDQQLARGSLGRAVAGGGEGERLSGHVAVAHGAARVRQVGRALRLHPGDHQFARAHGLARQPRHQVAQAVGPAAHQGEHAHAQTAGCPAGWSGGRLSRHRPASGGNGRRPR